MFNNNVSYKDLLSEIMPDYDSGGYYYEYHPLPTYPDNHVFDEELSVRRNREMVQEANEAASKAKKDALNKQAELDKKFQKDCMNYLMGLYGFKETVAKKIYEYCYSEKHSSMYEFFHYLDEMGDFVDECLQKQGVK